MLDLISDYRSGSKLELVIPALNEKEHLKLFVNYYQDHFDLVVLDGGSDQDTINWMTKNKITIYKRTTADPAEAHFVWYTNTLSKSGKTFYLLADEYVEKNKLLACNEFLTECKQGIVKCKKFEWTYGKHNLLPKKPKILESRGFSKGAAVYNPENLHLSVLHKPDISRFFNCELHHLHIWSMQSTFGKAGAYATIEVKQFVRSKNLLKNFFKRFIYKEMILLPKRLWQERNRGAAHLIWMIVMSISICSIGILCFIEQEFLLTTEKQKEMYSKFFLN